MKILVAYMSISGNTKKIAEAIHSELPEGAELKPINEITDLSQYDFSFIGFPVHQFGAPKQLHEFLGKETANKKIAVFVTHATGSHMEVLEGQLNKCKEAVKDAELTGFFNCQGALSEEVAEKMKQHENPQLREFAEKRKFTLGHPNEEAITKAKDFAKKMVSKI